MKHGKKMMKELKGIEGEISRRMFGKKKPKKMSFKKKVEDEESED